MALYLDYWLDYKSKCTLIVNSSREVLHGTREETSSFHSEASLGSSSADLNVMSRPSFMRIVKESGELAVTRSHEDIKHRKDSQQ